MKRVETADPHTKIAEELHDMRRDTVELLKKVVEENRNARKFVLDDLSAMPGVASYRNRVPLYSLIWRMENATIEHGGYMGVAIVRVIATHVKCDTQRAIPQRKIE